MADISKIKIEDGTYDIKDVIARQSIATLQNSLLTDLVVIGDSYTALNTSTWAEDFAAQLNLTLHKHAQASMGYVHQVNSQTFINLLDWSDTSFYDNVKYVICYGGINDYDATRAEIENAVVSFVNKAKTNFPHAQIILVGPQSSANQFSSKRNVKERVAIERGAMKSGVAYVNCENWLMNTTFNYTDTYVEDLIHPSALGYKIITSKMLGIINNQCHSDIDLQFTFNSGYTGTLRKTKEGTHTHFSAKINGTFTQGNYVIPFKIEGSYTNNTINLEAFGDKNSYYPAYKIDGNGNASEFIGCARLSKSAATGVYGLYIVPIVSTFTGQVAVSGDIYLNWTEETSSDM